MLSIEIFKWLDDRLHNCKFDLASSGVPGYDLAQISLDNELLSIGYEETRKLFVKKLSHLYGVHEENVIPVNGGSEAIFLAASYQKLSSRRTVIPVPEYEPIFKVPEFIGQNTLKVQINNLLSVLNTGDSIMMTSPNNPEGAIRATGKLMDFINDNNGSVKYVSETFSDFASFDAPKTIFKPNRGIITSDTLTKFYGLSDVRCGWMIADDDAILQLKTIKNMMNVKNSIYSLAAGLYALNHRDIFASRARKLIDENRKIVNAFLERCGITEPARRLNSTTIFLRYKGGDDSLMLASKIFSETGVLVTPGIYFGEDHALRIGYTAEPEKLIEGLDQLQKFLRKNVKELR